MSRLSGIFYDQKVIGFLAGSAVEDTVAGWKPSEMEAYEEKNFGYDHGNCICGALPCCYSGTIGKCHKHFRLEREKQDLERQKDDAQSSRTSSSRDLTVFPDRSPLSRTMRTMVAGEIEEMDAALVRRLPAWRLSRGD